MGKLRNWQRVAERALVHEKVIVGFYNAIAGADAESIDEVPEDVREFLAEMNFSDMARPLVLADLRRGVSPAMCKIRWGVTRITVRKLRARFRINKK